MFTPSDLYCLMMMEAEKQGFSIEELASLANITRRRLKDWEDGINYPTKSAFLNIKKALKQARLEKEKAC